MKYLISICAFPVLIILCFSRCQKTVVPPKTDTVIVKIHDTTTLRDTTTHTLTVQPGPFDGQDCLVGSIPPYAIANLSGNPDITASQWTYSAQGYGEGTDRGFLEFVALDGLPNNAKIKSATLYLYGLAPNTGIASPQGNSAYPGSPYSDGPNNACWLKRVTANWDQQGITWNNMPQTTDLHEVTVPASNTQWNYNVTLDITQLVQDIASSQQNYGFCLQLQSESIYRSLNFAGSRNADSTRWPKLVVKYTFD